MFRQEGVIYIYTDGACKNNGGDKPSIGIGILIEDHTGKGIFEVGMGLGHGTSNEAEYYAALAALFKTEELGLQRIKLFTDSKLVVDQISGECRCKADNLIPLRNWLKDMMAKFESVEFIHISREANHSTDALAKKASRRGEDKEWLEWFRDRLDKLRTGNSIEYVNSIIKK